VAVDPELRGSPLLDVLLDAFARETGIRATVLPSADGADLLLAPSSEPPSAGPEARDVCWTSYVLLGPRTGAKYSYGELNYESWARESSPVVGRGPITGSSASRLFQEMRLAAFPFVSRGDGSENHRRETRFWGPEGPCRDAQRNDFKISSYTETRQPMDHTVAIADENSAYTLCDLATYLRLRRTIRLEVVLARDSELRVSYRVTLVEPLSAPPERARAARTLRDWLGTASCRASLQAIRVDGERPFYAPGEDLAPTIRGRLDPEIPGDYDEEAEDR
jgi:ABC-type tungstate transport system permease subunit